MKRTARVSRRDEAVFTDPVDVTGASIELHQAHKGRSKCQMGHCKERAATQCTSEYSTIAAPGAKHGEESSRMSRGSSRHDVATSRTERPDMVQHALQHCVASQQCIEKVSAANPLHHL